MPEETLEQTGPGDLIDSATPAPALYGFLEGSVVAPDHFDFTAPVLEDCQSG
jgi:hypothetical protein